MQYNPALDQKRWLAYFDFLGIKNLVNGNEPYRVFHAYEDALKQIRNHQERSSRLKFAWFSDTFIIYTDTDGLGGFVGLEQFCRWFVHFMILSDIPLRGSISCDDFYADSDHHIYFGKALVEAYEYGEDADWIGYFLCPSAVDQLASLDKKDVLRLNYAFHQIPFKRRKAEKLPACVLGEYAKTNDWNSIIPALEGMRQRQQHPNVIAKYDNTLSFIRSNQGRWKIASSKSPTFSALDSSIHPPEIHP